MTRTLYHYRHSPFARRVRMALALKGLDCVLCEARGNPAYQEEARRLVPTRTLPVFVDGARALGDSTAIVHYLDRAYPGAHLWPDGEDLLDVFHMAATVDAALNAVIDTGTRFFALRDSGAWTTVKDEMAGRARRALEGLSEHVRGLGRPTIARSGWSAADIWLYTMVVWIEGWAARAGTAPNIDQVLTLGVTVPASLSKWADAHRDRKDVLALIAQDGV